MWFPENNGNIWEAMLGQGRPGQSQRWNKRPDIKVGRGKVGGTRQWTEPKDVGKISLGVDALSGPLSAVA